MGIQRGQLGIGKTKSYLETGRLRVAFFLTSSYIVVQMIGSLLTGSLALLADIGHTLTDAGGLGLALIAISFARRPVSPQHTYGFYRMEILASLANSALLIVISLYVLIEAYRRVLQPPEIQSLIMIFVAAMGLVVNLLSLRLLKTYSEQSLNIRAVYLEVLSDTLGSIGIVLAGLIMLMTQFYLADPLISVGLAIFILPRAWLLMKRAIHILMEGTPMGVSYEEVKKAILQTRGVTGVSDLHIWTITSGLDALSAHVAIIDPSRSQEILSEIGAMLEKDFKITHTTIQIETYHPESYQE